MIMVGAVGETGCIGMLVGEEASAFGIPATACIIAIPPGALAIWGIATAAPWPIGDP
jgi:hypothetical protein